MDCRHCWLDESWKRLSGFYTAIICYHTWSWNCLLCKHILENLLSFDSCWSKMPYIYGFFDCLVIDSLKMNLKWLGWIHGCIRTGKAVWVQTKLMLLDWKHRTDIKDLGLVRLLRLHDHKLRVTTLNIFPFPVLHGLTGFNRDHLLILNIVKLFLICSQN